METGVQEVKWCLNSNTQLGMGRAGIHAQTCLTPIDNPLTLWLLALSRGNTSHANYKTDTYHKIKWIKSSMVQSYFIRRPQRSLQPRSPSLESGAKRVFWAWSIFKWVALLVIYVYFIPVLFFLFLVINFEVSVPKWYTYKILSITSLVSWIVNTPKEQKQYHKEVLMSWSWKVNF